MRLLHRSLDTTLSRVTGWDSSMSNQSECMYCVLSFIAEEKMGGFQPIVDSSAEASRAGHLLVELLVLVAGGRAVDHDGGPLDRGLRLVGDLVAERLEVRDLVGIHGEPSASLDQVVDLRPLRRHWGPLVERDLVDAQ